jgi:hypothetical protein
MISENQFKEFLKLRTETRSIEFKERFNWTTASKAERCEIVKDVLACLNTQDGGVIIFGVRDGTFEPIGLDADSSTSFDTTKVNDFLRGYTDPPASCEVQRFCIDGKEFVALIISEFPDQPIICKKDGPPAEPRSQPSLRAGAIYIRTERATSEAISAPETMREQLNRALLRKGDQLLRQIEELLSSRSKAKADNADVCQSSGSKAKANNTDVCQPGSSKSEANNANAYQSEIEAADSFIRSGIPIDWTDAGYFRLTAYPTTYVPEMFENTSSTFKCLVESQVSLRGWPFPYIDRTTKSNFNGGAQSHTAGRHEEGFRVHRDGLFVWMGIYWEDSIPEFTQQAPSVSKSLSFINLIYTVTEMYVFLKRFYERAVPEGAVSISLEMHGLKGRKLISANSGVLLPGNYVSQVERTTCPRECQVSTLRAKAEEFAIEDIRQIFEIFNWNAPRADMIRGWQMKLLTRTF